MKLYLDIKDAIEKTFPELAGQRFDFQPTPDNQPGDIGLACFRFAGIMKKKPNEVSALLAGVTFPSVVTEAVPAGPYLNFTLDRTGFSTELVNEVMTRGSDFGSSRRGHGRRVLLEHTSINPNASPHIGRARNGLIGDTFARLLRFEG